MKLFEQPKVTKFFDMLAKLNRAVDEKHGKKCEKQVFVERTVNKWLKGKKLVLYKTTKDFDLEYKQYLHITRVEYALGWGEELRANVYDYTQPFDIFNSVKLSHNDITRLEGEWDVNEEVFANLFNLFTLDIPEKEYIYQTYDFDRYPKRVKNEDEAREKIRGTLSFFAKTEKEADKKKRKFQEENTYKLYIAELIEIR